MKQYKVIIIRCNLIFFSLGYDRINIQNNQEEYKIVENMIKYLL